MAGSDFSRIAINIAALQSLNAMRIINAQLGRAQLRLATGKRINSAADDAAGLTIATKMDYKTRGLGQVLSNIADSKSLIAVAEGHLRNINDILGVMKTKAEQAANDTLGTDEREAILAELQALNTQIDNEVAQAKWTDTELLTNVDFNFQIGVGTSSSDELLFNVVGQSGVVVSGFNSDNLSVNAGTAVSAWGSWAVDSGGASFTTEALGTLTASNVTLGEVGSGNYRLYVDSIGDGGTATVTVKVKNVTTGNWVTIGRGAGATSVAVGGVGASGTTVDLGIGLSFDVGGLDTNDGDTEAAVYSYTFTHSGTSVGSQTSAQAFMDLVDTASDSVSKALGYIGATINRLDYQEASLSVAKVNIEAAYNRVMNADMAYEQVEATKYAILQQTAVAMLAQANLGPQTILALFR